MKRIPVKHKIIERFIGNTSEVNLSGFVNSFQKLNDGFGFIAKPN